MKVLSESCQCRFNLLWLKVRWCVAWLFHGSAASRTSHGGAVKLICVMHCHFTVTRFLRSGCSAGFLNVPKIKGSHTAMKFLVLTAIRFSVLRDILTRVKRRSCKKLFSISIFSMQKRFFDFNLWLLSPCTLSLAFPGQALWLANAQPMQCLAASKDQRQDVGNVASGCNSPGYTGLSRCTVFLNERGTLWRPHFYGVFCTFWTF